jgi:CDP-diacylglycerol---glycerol-3-phosphate 3-phosphatidyltransferase
VREQPASPRLSHRRRSTPRLHAIFPVNLPNVLTVLRILLIPVLVVALLGETDNGDIAAAVVFALASATDYLDGWLARSRDAITPFGKIMDPVADKLLVIAALVSLVSLDRLAGWVAMVIIARELAVTVARAQAPEVIPAAQLGKVKTVLQVAAIFFVILFDPTPMWVDALVYAAVAATVISGVTFFLDLGRRQRAPLGEERGL